MAAMTTGAYSGTTGFNGATTSRPWMDRAPGRAARVHRASTEPRPRDRGWRVPRRRGAPEEGASTEPRPRDRGWKKPAKKSPATTKLQRSHDLATVDGRNSIASP